MEEMVLTTVLWTTGNGPRAFAADFFFEVLVCASGMDTERLWSRTQGYKVSVELLIKERTAYGRATSRSSLFAAISSPSRLFQFSRTSADGAHPRMPGWMRPANLTWGMCRLVQ